MTEKIIIKLNASACKKSACARILYFDVIEGLKAKEQTSISMHYGTACHKFAELYVQTKDFTTSIMQTHSLFRKKAVDDDKKEWLNINHLTLSCAALQAHIDADTNFEYAINPIDNKPLTEVRFAIPYISTEYVDVLLCGTVDKIGQFKRGAYCIGDYKTTSTYKVDDYFTQYQLDCQMMFYRYCMEWYAKNTSDNILAEVGSHRLGCFIDGVFLGKTKDTEVRRSPIMFHSDEDMNEFEALLQAACYDLILWAQTKHWPRKEGMFNGACNHLYGKCKYYGICASPDKVAAQHVINNHFNIVSYDPLSY